MDAASSDETLRRAAAVRASSDDTAASASWTTRSETFLLSALSDFARSSAARAVLRRASAASISPRASESRVARSTAAAASVNLSAVPRNGSIAPIRTPSVIVSPRVGHARPDSAIRIPATGARTTKDAPASSRMRPYATISGAADLAAREETCKPIRSCVSRSTVTMVSPSALRETRGGTLIGASFSRSRAISARPSMKASVRPAPIPDTTTIAMMYFTTRFIAALLFSLEDSPSLFQASRHPKEAGVAPRLRALPKRCEPGEVHRFDRG